MLKLMMTVILSLLLAATTASALPVKVDGKVSWVAHSMAGIVKVPGEGGIVAGILDTAADGKTSGTLDCNLGAFKTGVDLRDEHLHTKFLGTGTGTLKLDPVKATAKEFEWTGNLTLKGETKPVKGKATLEGEDLWAEFEVNINDYPAIGAPAWKDVVVDKTIVVTVKAKAK